MRRKINGLPALNQSQYHAVDKALNNTFTLIQGPPGRCVNLCTLMVHIFCKGLNHFLCLLGTGKTVVGVYIVHSFFEHNSKKKRKWDDPKDKEKKEVILYCGPSNKSVDVVAGKLCWFSAEFNLNFIFEVVIKTHRVLCVFYCCNTEYLMRFKDSLRPLRVYSQEVEMLDFPFPDCKLQFSQRTLRQDRSKPELRYCNHISWWLTAFGLFCWLLV